MQSWLATPSDSPLWGWRWVVRWYVAAGLVAILVLVVTARGCGLHGSFGPAWTGGGHARRGVACLLSYEDAPRVDAVSGLVVLPSVHSSDFAAAWNEGVSAVIRRDGPVEPSFRDRVLDSKRIAAEFDRDPGTDVGDGTAEFQAADARVRVEVYDCGGCGTGVPDRLRCGDASTPIDRHVLRVRGPEGGWRNRVAGNVGRGRIWFPHMTSMRARTSEDGRTLWLRGEDVEEQRWIVTVDLVTGTVLQIDPDPAG